MESQQANELLPVRLNAEPSIFRGCSLSELMLLVTVGGIALVPGSVIVCGLFGYLMMGVGIGLLLVIAWVVIGATVLQKLKRGRPLGYYQLRLRLCDAHHEIAKQAAHNDTTGHQSHTAHGNQQHQF